MINKINLRDKLNKMSGLELVNYMWLIVVFSYLFIRLNYYIDYDKIMPINWLSQALPIIMTALFAVKTIFIDEYSIKIKLLFTAIILVVFLSACISQRDYLVALTVTAISAKDIPYRWISKAYFAAYTLTFVESMLMLVLGITEDWVDTRATSSGVIMRHALGYYHSNGLGMVSMGIVFAALVLIYKKRKIWSYIILAAFVAAIYYVTTSRASSGAALLAIVGCLVASKISDKLDKCKALPYLLGAVVIVIAVALLALSIKFDSNESMYQMLDKIMSTRLSLANTAINEYGISLMGQEADINYAVDIMFVMSAICDGIIPLVIWVGGMAYATIHTAKQGRWELCIICCCIVLYSTMESGMISICNMAALALVANLNESVQTKKVQDI